jgi:phage baseplate assembly protein W
MSLTRKVYDFKSIGESEQERKDRVNVLFEDTPIGIITPLRLSNTNSSFFEMNVDLKKQIRDNFRNMVSTNHGERLMLNDFGGNLSSLAFELGSESIDAEAMKRIVKTTSKYMPFVVLNSFEPTKETSLDGTLARVGLIIVFSVPSLSIEEQSVKVILNVAG